MSDVHWEQINLELAEAVKKVLAKHGFDFELSKNFPISEKKVPKNFQGASFAKDGVTARGLCDYYLPLDELIFRFDIGVSATRYKTAQQEAAD